MHVVVAVGQKRVPQRSKDARLIAAEMVGEDQVQCGAGLRVVVIMPLRLVPAAAVRHLFRRQAEEKEIFFARFFCHLDGRAIARADGQRPVHHELHVARAAGFVAGGGNLIGDISCRNQPLRHRNTVVRQEQNLEPSADDRIPVDSAGEIVDELDDYLGQLIGGRRLAGEEESSRRHLEIRVLTQPIVKHYDPKRVQQLALVFMDALDLAIEDAVGIYRLTGGPLEPIDKLQLWLRV